MKKKCFTQTVLFFFVLLCTKVYAGYTYDFENITNNQTTNAQTGENQLKVSVELDPIISNQVIFTFMNLGPNASSITDIYFDDNTGTLSSFIGFGYPTTGVAYSEGAKPGDLPGGKNFNFSADKKFSYDADSPVQPNGVNPGEELKLAFYLIKDMEVFSALDETAWEKNLRIGIHVQGFADGGSESFINGRGSDPGSTVPEPATLILVGLGLISLAGVQRRKR